MIEAIKQRIISEHAKHKDLDWEEIAARKIFSSFKSFSVEFTDWALHGQHPYEQDNFCVGEHEGMWHDDFGGFITTEQLFEKFLKQREK